MKPVLPKSFYFIRGVIYVLILMSLLGCLYNVFGVLIPAIAADKPLPLIHRTEKIDLSISGKPENDILSLEYFHFNPGLNHREGDITLLSKTGKLYKGYYSSKLEKLRVILPEDFTRPLQIYTRIVYFENPILIFIVFYVIVTLLRSLEAGSPFTIKNAKYIGFVAAITFFFTAIGFISDWMFQSYLESEFSLVFKVVPNLVLLDALLFSVVLAVVAYIVKQGVKMKEEQDLTI